MPEFELHPKPRLEAHHVYSQLRSEVTAELVKRAIGHSLADELLDAHPLHEYEARDPEFVAWARSGVANAESQWEKYYVGLGYEGPLDKYLGMSDAKDYVNSFILDHVDTLSTIYKKAQEDSIDLSNPSLSRLILTPTLLLRKNILEEYNGEPNITYLLESFRAETDMECDEIAPSILNRLVRGDSLGSRPVNELLDQYLKTSDWHISLVTGLVEGNTEAQKNGLGRGAAMSIIEWFGATLQEPEWMAQPKYVALPAHVVEQSGLKFVTCGSYDDDEKRFTLDLLPANPDVIATRSVFRA